MLHIRQVRWNMPADMARFADPFDGVRQGCSAPLTLCVRDASLPDALLHEHLRALRRIPIPVAGIEAPVVLHGEGCGLRFYAPHGAAVTWWGDGPDEWKMFIAAVHRLYDDLAGRFE